MTQSLGVEKQDGVPRLIESGVSAPASPRERLSPPAAWPRLVWPEKAAALALADDPGPELVVTERVHDAGSSRAACGEDEEPSEGVKSAACRNLLIHGDNRDILAALASRPRRHDIDAAGGVRLIYLDPPFATGGSFGMDIPVGEPVGGRQETVRVQAYRDAWGGGLTAYLSMLAPRLRLLHDLLADDGSLYFHCDYRAAAHARLLLDEIFGPNRLLNEIVWTYGLGNAGSRRAFGRKHDTILLYTKTDRYHFNEQRGEITAAMAAKYRHTRPDGTRYMRSYGKEYDLRGGKPLDSVWDIPAVAATSRERVGYPTQKPEALLERIILASSDPGDLVLDPFCGAGTTLAVADRLGRRWIGCDASRLAVWTARKRLGPAAGPFEMAVSEPADGDLTCAYMLHPRVVVEREGDTLRVRLDHIRVTGEPPNHTRQGGRLAIEDGLLVRYRSPHGEPARRELVTREWVDWLDGWSISLDKGAGAPFVATWEATRTTRQRSIPLRSGVLVGATTTSGRVTIRVTDIFGRSWDTTVSTV